MRKQKFFESKQLSSEPSQGTYFINNHILYYFYTLIILQICVLQPFFKFIHKLF
jgi:hypothetical protein